MSKMRKPNQAETQALNEGDAAARSGKTVDDCPYRDAIGLRLMWVTGHQNAMSDIESARKRQQEAEDKKKLEAFPYLLAERDALLAALDEAQKDAKRYRTIRQQHEECDSGITMCVFQPVNGESLEPVGCMPGELDDAVDAIAAQEGSQDA